MLTSNVGNQMCFAISLLLNWQRLHASQRLLGVSDRSVQLGLSTETVLKMVAIEELLN